MEYDEVTLHIVLTANSIDTKLHNVDTEDLRRLNQEITDGMFINLWNYGYPGDYYLRASHAIAWEFRVNGSAIGLYD